MKRSDSPVKVLNPGAKRLWRVYDERGRATADVLSTADQVVCPGSMHLHHHARPDVSRSIVAGDVDELLHPVVAGGRVVADGLDDLTAASERRIADVERLDPGVRRLVNPHTYHVSITDQLFALKRQLLSGLDQTSG
jgi:nicotinate phosphoribosyltransferase